jgi:hypothetical protein
LGPASLPANRLDCNSEPLGFDLAVMDGFLSNATCRRRLPVKPNDQRPLPSYLCNRLIIHPLQLIEVIFKRYRGSEMPVSDIAGEFKKENPRS